MKRLMVEASGALRAKRGLTAAALIVAALGLSSLSACNTMSGAGEDMSAAGRAVENSAEQNKGY